MEHLLENNNLKVLDLSNAIAISADSLIQLIFRHAYTILHQVVVGLSLISECRTTLDGVDVDFFILLCFLFLVDW